MRAEMAARPGYRASACLDETGMFASIITAE
jgi:hypothetical protein